ncbi:hypothetical protein [Pseudomonas sp. TWP3-1]|uniref:hypothetical protein n=1 Tax=Pseudomonas sp. TWP3-1 TaxID=2804631 RepID=UPI003CF11E9D
MKRELAREAMNLVIVTSMVSLISAYGQMGANGTQGWLFKSKLLGSLWIDSLPGAAGLVLMLMIPLYAVRFLLNRRAKA